MKKKHLFFVIKVLLCLTSISTVTIVNGQNVFPWRRNNIWQFGDHAGINFNSGIPVAQNSSVFSNEGTASISDINGNLLMYTNGSDIWNRNNAIMTNGNNIFGANTQYGGISTSQSSVIVPMPGDANKYYVFSLGTSVANEGNLYYSVVDMTLSGGLGSVIVGQKNIGLVTGVPLAEKIVAIAHNDGSGYWIVVHDMNTNFRVYQISVGGINTTPVISSVGVSHNGGEIYNNYNAVGCMKASQNGSRLALVIKDRNPGIQIFDFNNSTGTVSNPISLAGLDANDVTPEATDIFNYGLEFSPNGQVLYIGDLVNGRILQYNLTSGIQANIQSSETVIGNSTTRIGSLQIGPDCRIYVARTNSYSSGQRYVGVINNPNTLGLGSNYVDQAVDLGASGLNVCIQGLPNFSTPEIFRVTGAMNVCESSTGNVYTASNTGYSYSWTVVSGNATVQSNTANQATISFGTPGTAQIKVEETTSCIRLSRTFTVTINAKPTVTITNLEDEYCSGYYNVNLTGTPSGGTFTVNGSSATVFEPSVVGTSTIVYSYTNSSGCSNTASKQVVVKECCKYKIGDATATCGDVSNRFCIPLTSTMPVDKGIIGMDYCLQYDPALMTPTGNYTLGTLVTKGNASWANAYLNTTTAGRVRASIHYTSAAPAGTLFQGSGNVICIEFTLLAGAPIGTNALTSCELEEAYLLNEKPACWDPGTLTVSYDNQLKGRLIYQGNLSKTLGMGYAITNTNMAVTRITGVDASCNSTTSPISPVNTGNFDLPVSSANKFKIERDIKTLPTTPAYATMRFINGYDTYLMQNITTKKTTGANVVLPTPYMMIAADVNMNDKVRANDITLVQERIVKKITEYPQVWNSAPNPYSNSLDWRYIDKRTVDSDPTFVRSTAYPELSGVGFHRDDVPNVPFCLPVRQQCIGETREIYSGILLGDLFDGGPISFGTPESYPNSGSNPYIRMSAEGKEVVSAPVEFEIDDITTLGNDMYRIYIKHIIDPKDTLVSFDFVLDYNEAVLSVIDVQQTSDCKAAEANVMWNNADNSELILTSFATSVLPSTGILFYIDVYKQGGTPTVEDLGSMAAFLNGVEVTPGAHLRSTTENSYSELSGVNSISISPNPSADVTFISYFNMEMNSKIEIVNSLGQTVKSYTGLAQEGVIQLDITSFAKGVYYCIMTNGDKKIVKKIVVS